MATNRNDSIDVDACVKAAAACACFNFRKASRAVTQLFDTVLQPSGLRSTQFVILVAVGVDQPARMPDLARTLTVDRSTLTRNLQPLERDGLVKTTASPDARASTVKLTAKGRRLLAQTFPLWEEAQTRFVRQVGSGRWKSMLRDLSQVVNAAHKA